MSVNIEWLKSTFKTQERTEELLRPELENGNLTAHDFELAVKHLPSRILSPFEHGLVASSVVAAYGFLYRRPPWPTRHISLWTGITALGGTFFGGYREINRHIRFSRSLDNPKGLQAALKNVSERANGPLPLVNENNGETNREDGSSEQNNQLETERQNGSNSPAAAPEKLSSHRWDEIRAANARNAKNSSWDVLRQDHERQQIQKTPSSEPPSSQKLTAQEERALEQEQFNAMLEEERRKSQS